MFRSEGSELVKGSMLALTIDAILDFAGERTGQFRMIECEVSSHDAYGTPRELFIAFFGVIAETLREMLGADWSPEIDAAWRKLLARDRTHRSSRCTQAVAISPHLIRIWHCCRSRSATIGSTRVARAVPIVRHCLHPRRVQSTPTVKNNENEGASDVRD